MTTRSAPRRLAVRQESIAVLPPPTTITRRPMCIGVSVSGFDASIRLTRVRYSLLDITLMLFSPGMPMKLGRPAPDPTKMPLKPCSSSSFTLTVLPTRQSFSNFTPMRSKFRISTSTILFGRRNSGMPYFSTPPISWRASNTVTS